MFVGGRSDYLKEYEDTYNELLTIRRKYFCLLFEEWQKSSFALEDIEGGAYRLNTPTIIGGLLKSSNANFGSRHPQGCFIYVGKMPAGERPLVSFTPTRCVCNFNIYVIIFPNELTKYYK